VLYMSFPTSSDGLRKPLIDFSALQALAQPSTTRLQHLRPSFLSTEETEG
jgi:hypothetical protein